MKTIPLLWSLFTLILVACSNRGAILAAEEPVVGARGATPRLAATRDGKRDRDIRCGLHDQAGNHWFGTTGDGVYRYDGKDFTHFTIEDGLTSNTVWSILEDRKGRIWFGTDAGLSRWDGTSIREIPIDAAIRSTVLSLTAPVFTLAEQTDVWSMLEDKAGTIWFGTGEGLLCLKDEILFPFLNSINRAQNPSGLRLKMVDAMLEDRQGNLWFASGMPPGLEGLCRFDGTVVTQFNPGGEKWIRSVIEDSQGTLWLGTRSRGVWRYDGKTFSQVSEQPGLGMPLLVDRSGNIWFNGESYQRKTTKWTGVWRYDGKTYRYFSTKDGLRDFCVWSMFEDRDGDLWVGARNMGLFRFDGTSFTCFSE
ncbi:MAG: hypothetical protein NT069_19680 [Planctomycetota bacterium]|nr:hypothetical protein [Planctomycetota bacterium]